MDFGGNFSAPMSERQQLALIKKLEKEKAAAAASTSTASTSSGRFTAIYIQPIMHWPCLSIQFSISMVFKPVMNLVFLKVRNI